MINKNTLMLLVFEEFKIVSIYLHMNLNDDKCVKKWDKVEEGDEIKYIICYGFLAIIVIWFKINFINKRRFKN